MGGQKLLLPLGGTSIVRRVAERVVAAGLDGVVVVLGHEASAIRKALDGLACGFTENRRYREGMGTSFGAAVDAFEHGVAAALFVLADQPFVTTPMLEELVDTYRRTKATAVLSRFGGIVAPPHVIDASLFAELRRLRRHGAKELLRRHCDACVTVDFPPQGALDVDDAQSYRRALEVAAGEA